MIDINRNAETPSNGRQIRRTAKGYAVQPPVEDYWIDCPTVEEARRIALGVVDVAGCVDMLEKAEGNEGVFPAMGATVEQTGQVLAGMRDGLLDIEGSEMAKAACVCRRLGIE